MKDITLGKYIPGNSCLHNLDPRTKLFVALMMILSLYILPSLKFYALFFLILCTLHHFAGFSPKMICQDFRSIWLLLFFTYIMRLLITPGEALILKSIVLPVTFEGIYSATQMTLRIALMVSTGSLLSRLSTPKALAEGIHKSFSFLEQFNFPMDEIAVVTMLAFRFIPTLQLEIQNLMDAQRSRGVIFEEGNLIQKSRRIIGLLPPLFFSLLRRSDELATAMIIRGYTGEKQKRSTLHPLQYKKTDYFAYSLCFLFIALVLLIRAFVFTS